MSMSDTLLANAFAFACEAHKDQRRKYTNEPYVNHCASVAARVASMVNDAEVVAAALLHDVIEDTQIGYEQLERVFGKRVADLVLQVTDPSKPRDGNRDARKAIDRAFYATVCTEAKIIKLADLIDNTFSIQAHDPNFCKVYMREKRAMLAVLKDCESPLWVVADAIVTQWERQQATEPTNGT
jgi:(p)ppGpp synthase/HD superfamily hydrolase